MLAASINALGKVRLTQRFGRFEFVVKLTGFASPVLTGNIETVLNQLKIELFRVSPSGSVALFQKIGLFTAMIASCANEGVIKCYTTGGVTYIKGSVEATDHGSLAVMDNDYYELVLSENWPLGGVIDIYAVDYDTLTKSHNIYENVSCDANATRELNIVNTRLILLPKVNLQRVELVMVDGTRNTYEAPEIESIVRDGLELVGIDEGKVVTMDDFDILPVNVAAARAVRLTYSAITVVTKVSAVDIQS